MESLVILCADSDKYRANLDSHIYLFIYLYNIYIAHYSQIHML